MGQRLASNPDPGSERVYLIVLVGLAVTTIGLLIWASSLDSGWLAWGGICLAGLTVLWLIGGDPRA